MTDKTGDPLQLMVNAIAKLYEATPVFRAFAHKVRTHRLDNPEGFEVMARCTLPSVTEMRDALNEVIEAFEGG